jgi:hypothetical protein
MEHLIWFQGVYTASIIATSKLILYISSAVLQPLTGKFYANFSSKVGIYVLLLHKLWNADCYDPVDLYVFLRFLRTGFINMRCGQLIYNADCGTRNCWHRKLGYH